VRVQRNPTRKDSIRCARKKLTCNGGALDLSKPYVKSSPHCLTYHGVRVIGDGLSEGEVERHLEMKGDEVDAEAESSERHEHFPGQKVIDEAAVAFDACEDDPGNGNSPGKPIEPTIDGCREQFNFRRRVKPGEDSIKNGESRGDCYYPASQHHYFGNTNFFPS